MDGTKSGASDIAALVEDESGQSVRLPEGYRFDASEVRVRREGNALVLEPVAEKSDEWAWLDDLTGFSDDMVDSILNDRPGADSYERPEFSLDK
jgi:antitoxin VapB